MYTVYYRHVIWKAGTPILPGTMRGPAFKTTRQYSCTVIEITIDTNLSSDLIMST